MKISFYNGVSDRKGVNTSVKHILERIRLGFYNGPIERFRATKNPELKKALPGATFSGTFDERNDKRLVSYSGIVVLDIDEKDYQKVMLAKVELAQDDWVYAFFESPSRGLKILIKVSSGADCHKDTAFPQVKQYIEDNYGLEVDNSGKNISRLCFVSADPDLHINDGALVFHIDESYKPAEFYEASKEYNNYEPSTSLDHIYTTAVDWTERTEAYCKGNRNNWIHQLSCILNRAGVSVYDAISLINMRRHPPRFQDWSKTVEGVYSRNSGQFNTMPIFQKKSEQGRLF